MDAMGSAPDPIDGCSPAPAVFQAGVVADDVCLATISRRKGFIQ